MAKAGSEVVLTVSTGYRDLTLTVPLPDLDDAIDLKVYIDGIEQTGAAYTGFKGILPNVKKTLDIPFTEQKASYRVSIRVARSVPPIMRPTRSIPWTAPEEGRSRTS